MAEGIILENVVKTYGSGDTAVHALRGVDMAVAKGEVIGLIAEQPTAVVNHDRCPGIGAHPCGAGSQVESQRMTEQDFLVPGLYGYLPAEAATYLLQTCESLLSPSGLACIEWQDGKGVLLWLEGPHTIR